VRKARNWKRLVRWVGLGLPVGVELAAWDCLVQGRVV
jgi:hypothetical protein